MKITITIDTSNAAFDADPGLETAHILRHLADDVEAFGPGTWNLHDYNGNTIGKITTKGKANRYD